MTSCRRPPQHPPIDNPALPAMPLENASDPSSTEMDLFGPSDTGDRLDSDNPYPQFTPLAPLSWVLGYSESDRQRYLRIQSQNTARLLKLDLAPLEQSGLAYYDSIFYTYESYGDLLGTSTGVAIGYALRNRPAGPIARGLARIIGQGANPRAAKYVAVGLRIAVFGSAGRLYGLTSAGLQALARMRREQSRDPGMARVVAARAARNVLMEREAKVKRRMQSSLAVSSDGDYDDDDDGDTQSLGGMEIADRVRLVDEATAREQSATFPFGRPSEKVVEMEMEKRRGGVASSSSSSSSETAGDPFEVETGPAGTADDGTPQRVWRNTHSNTAESSWERLRRGQSPAAAATRPEHTGDDGDGDGGSGGDAAVTGTSPWPARAPMKGFGGRSQEPKMDSFSFNAGGEKDLEKMQAQKEFDESVERERRSGAGDGYTKGDQPPGKGWKD